MLTEDIYAYVDQPAFEQMQIDHNISRVAIGLVCFLTIGVFYFTLVNFTVAKLLPIQQIQQLEQVVQSLNPSVPVASDRRVEALLSSQIGASAVPSASSASGPSATAAASIGTPRR